MASDVRGRRKTKIGVVVSSKMEKTVVVRVERVYSHPQYAKVVRDSSKYYAHNELDVKEGDTVRIQETRPLSKTKRWRVVDRVN
ncbi:30S ribosomal protein S17 [Chlamydia muridarum str. Nigg]|jgi:30S ribosomal protein S17|uniref:Small ribosomal subunit protein uS17 n=2 Tax=Chlamydia muridarum TaxID=83560 RepID=RS17_CHLMU|nr:30S ribosomal protein S17 [Chlamydia muridarum]Q9PJM3.1 RecName: Full=Small ribosomal subunit protein uS17; AltName: Full=30S ribosomal protein S17 [Chlamydia muridarum str. Nigg]UFX24809.1 30S ribosomal protein S17 [Chlamydia trachomatis]AAF39609.1 ribosomal protein S17 [Chlamydia muridarum str. Nigg]AHH23192.1 30S ribosomal protein S17 [Chlamydia muridarum str. Nigg3 CMUT3-5]AHH24118.1 30S ribosomal protein S17 [Chlamydia muridarum str. Nigg CM972]AID38319.1 30S ribosomal protein S17 [Ch